jgi:hypothetical protein
MNLSRTRIGFDLDNTLIDYSRSARVYGLREGLGEIRDLNMLRTRLRKDDSTDKSWQRAQSWIYTDGMALARISSGFVKLKEFLEQSGSILFVVSHKTEKTPDDFGGDPLRDLATTWIKNSLGLEFLKRDINLFFLGTRDEKVKKINDLGLSFFIDDLLDVLKHPYFPSTTQKIWYTKEVETNDSKIYRVREMKDLQVYFQNEL